MLAEVSCITLSRQKRGYITTQVAYFILVSEMTKSLHCRRPRGLLERTIEEMGLRSDVSDEQSVAAPT